MIKSYLARQFKIRKIFLIPVIFGICALFALSKSLYSTTDPLEAAGILKFNKKTSAPGFVIKDLEGNRVNLEDFRGKVVLLDFWTTW